MTSIVNGINIEKHKGLIYGILSNYTLTKGIERADLFQEAMIGLWKAAKSYDKTKGSFSNWARVYIKREVSIFLNSKAYLIRIPPTKYWARYKDERIASKNYAKTGLYKRPKSSDDVIRYVSLDMPLGGNKLFEDLTAAETDLGPDVIDILQQRSKRKVIALGKMAVDLNQLSEKEWSVLCLRYGVNSKEDEKTLQEIGDILGVTRQWVEQIEKRAITKFRKFLINRIKAGAFTND